MGNSNVKNTSGQYNNRPHSVLGVRGDDRYTLTDPDILSRYYHSPVLHPHPHYSQSNHQERSPSSNKVSGKAILPPLPRSHSFHQILRPTENGVNLIQKGTIRGIDHRHNQYHHNSGKDLQLTSADDSLNPELNAILRERRCKSEADLFGDADSDSAAQEDQSVSEKSTDRSIEGLRKGLTNGVAARIQRAKYKAPAPPVPVNRTSNDAPNGNNNINKNNEDVNCNDYNKMRSNGESKVPSASSGLIMYSDSNSRDSKRSLQAKEKSTPPPNKSKLSLIRRLSDKSYFPIGRTNSNGESRAEHNNLYPSKDKNFMLLPRLKDSSPSSPKLSHINENIKSKRDTEIIKTNRFNGSYEETNFQMYSDGNEPALNEINDFIARELALRSAVNDSPDGDNDKGSGRDENSGRRGVSKIFRRDKSNSNGKNNSFNVGSNHGDGQPVKNGKSLYLPPVFDDNFILKRTTPNAGLNGSNNITNKKLLDLYPSKINNHDLDKNRYNQEGQMSPKLGLTNLLSNNKHRHPYQHHQSNHQLDGLAGFEHHPYNHSSSGSPSPPDYHNRSSHHNSRQQKSPGDHRSQWILGNNYSRETTPLSLLSSSSPPPPPPPLPTLPYLPGDSSNLSSNRKYDSKEESITRLDSLKHLNHSSISDSANYSDEDDEEEIKVVLKPYLPPPRRLPFSEDPVIIADDLFNTDDNSITKCPPLTSSGIRQKHCWTPMEDLTSSDEEAEDDEDDDGIHCDPQSEDDDQLNGKRDVRDLINDYNTRFTLKNQLRTIIQNNKLRSSQGYP
ncbi:GATA zinc finger domain-containing protein 14-like [Tetranychus urticae]|uniref:Uncharacterized protein n=1 Tax=Tetranychus urticae TaxID=32264 RepID=T1KQ41_TETUR|nr:GATA zinc finger domain-containing protein 14-like [Tetranychus urticae]XP_025017430.1 GATA zinc finger domain-containing protein 14-like [Tetranychus urticae]